MLDAVLDLSHHNPVTAFWDIQRSGVVGVIHKATQGGAMIDAKFHDHLTRAKETGLLLGAYHFGTGSSGQKQAYHFLNVARQFAPLEDLLLVLDWEDNKTSTMTLEDAEQFVALVHRETKRYPVIYSGMAFFNARVRSIKPDESILRKCPLWIARYSADPPVLAKGWGPWKLWQYTSTGRCKGVQGNVDRNRFPGEEKELRCWWTTAGR